MAIDGVQANSVLSDLAFSNQPETEKSQSQSDKDMFMRLLLAQIENQDPLKPTDQTDFVAQLAQFSSLEGIQNLNSTVQDIGSMYRSSQALQATARRAAARRAAQMCPLPRAPTCQHPTIAVRMAVPS